MDDPWSVYDTYDGTDELSWNGCSFTIRNCNPKTVYTVKACADIEQSPGPAAEQESEPAPRRHGGLYLGPAAYTENMAG